jgi:hypothetical protein
MFVHGGRDNTSALNDLFMLEVVTSPPRWTEFSGLRDAPSPRCHHVAAVATKADDAAGALLYIFGGMSVDGSLLGDLYELDVSALQWRNLAAAAGAPSARKLHTLVLPPWFVCVCVCLCVLFFNTSKYNHDLIKHA